MDPFLKTYDGADDLQGLHQYLKHLFVVVQLLVVLVRNSTKMGAMISETYDEMNLLIKDISLTTTTPVGSAT